MNIGKILEEKLRRLPVGAHSDGLLAVKSHIDAAARHLQRGQEITDETLFTDVIFRCNQAFEGSIKEAYRVLAGRDPKKITPAEIERFLETSDLLRKKVLDQFTTYRREWRNPSTHDYTLDFDEDEALLAVVSVTAFAIVLCDQIDGKIAFDVAAAAVPNLTDERSNQASLLDLVTDAVRLFASEYVEYHQATLSTVQAYTRLEGALAGYLFAEFSDVEGAVVDQSRGFDKQKADVSVTRGGDKVVVELKVGRAKSSVGYLTNAGVARASLYLHEDDVVGAVVLVYLGEHREYGAKQADGIISDRVRIVLPTTGETSSN